MYGIKSLDNQRIKQAFSNLCLKLPVQYRWRFLAFSFIYLAVTVPKPHSGMCLHYPQVLKPFLTSPGLKELQHVEPTYCGEK